MTTGEEREVLRENIARALLATKPYNLSPDEADECADAVLALIEPVMEENERLKLLVEESLYHLRLDERAKSYHERALAALSPKSENSDGH